jgi:mycofactocin system glycosyltransferase
MARVSVAGWVRSSGPAALGAAPPTAGTPLPGTFGLWRDPATKTLGPGTVLMGGSPLRLLRLSARALALTSAWEHGAPVGARVAEQLLARRLVAAGLFHPLPQATTLTSNDVTVVIPVKDRAAQLHQLLSSLGHVATVVVDDGSTDAEGIREVTEKAGATLLRLPVNQGPSSARNAGLDLVATDLVAFIDSDCLPNPHWLDPLLGHFDDPLVAAVAPRIVPAPAASAASTALARYDVARSSLDMGTTCGPVRPQSRISYVPSAALVVRRQVAANPLFDPDLLGGEDVDLVWRLVEAGWSVRYVPTSTVAHGGPTSATAFMARRAFYGTTAGPLARRHPSDLSPLQTSIWTAAVWGLAAARRPYSAAMALGVSILVLAKRLDGLVDAPLGTAATIAGGGTVRSALPGLSGLTRAWSPALAVGLLFRRTRRAAAFALLAPAVRDWASHPRELDLARFSGLHVVDDLAYGSGVWRGCVTARTLRPLLPRIALRSRTWGHSSLRSDLGQPPGPAQ